MNTLNRFLPPESRTVGSTKDSQSLLTGAFYLHSRPNPRMRCKFFLV